MNSVTTNVTGIMMMKTSVLLGKAPEALCDCRVDIFTPIWESKAWLGEGGSGDCGPDISGPERF